MTSRSDDSEGKQCAIIIMRATLLLLAEITVDLVQATGATLSATRSIYSVYLYFSSSIHILVSVLVSFWLDELKCRWTPMFKQNQSKHFNANMSQRLYFRRTIRKIMQNDNVLAEQYSRENILMYGVLWSHKYSQIYYACCVMCSTK